MSDTQIAVTVILAKIENALRIAKNPPFNRTRELHVRSTTQEIAEVVLASTHAPTTEANLFTIDPVLNEIGCEWHEHMYWIYPEVAEAKPPLECIIHFLRTAQTLLSRL